MKIIFASRNKGKIREVKELLDGKFEVLSLLEVEGIPDIEETGSTFEENAKIKAEAVFKYTGVPSVADDSGLEVFQLDGRPGVYSARYSGENATDEDNNIKLIEKLKDYPEPHYAQYVCVAVYFDGKKYLSAEGKFKGRIVNNPRGTNGFGYDPIFVADGFDKTMGEVELGEKNKISHRAIAFKKLRKMLTETEYS